MPVILDEPFPYLLCLRCRGTFTDEQAKGHAGCPACGNTGVPGDLREKAEIKLTHHEWRILFMWADNWAEQCLRNDEAFHSPIPGILREARKQVPDLPALTMSEEIQDAVDTVPGVTKAELHQGDDVQHFEKKKKH